MTTIPGSTAVVTGGASGRHLLDIPDEQIETTFAVNTLALYWVTKAFLGGMVDRDRGHVVTVASAAGLVGVARQTDYSASKPAAVGFDESLRVELAQVAPGVKTSVICPFYVSTRWFDKLMDLLGVNASMEHFRGRAGSEG